MNDPHCLCSRDWINGKCLIHSGSSAMPMEERLALAQKEVFWLKGLLETTAGDLVRARNALAIETRLVEETLEA